MRVSFNKTKPIRTKHNDEDWGSMEWVLDDTLVEGAGMSVALMEVKPGMASPAHIHANCHEFISVVEGSVEVSFEHERVLLNPGESVFVPGGTAHGIKNIGETQAKMVLSYSAGRRKYESV